MRIKIKVKDAFRRLEAAVPSKTISSGRVGARPAQDLAGRAIRVKLPKIPTRIITGRRLEPKIRPQRAIAPVEAPAQRPIRKIRTEIAPRTMPKVKLPLVQQPTALRRAKASEPRPGEQVFVLGKKQTNEVEKALSQREYRKKFGYARDLTAPTGSSVGRTFESEGGQVRIILGPAPVNHSGRLRKNGKPSPHWVAFAYLIEVGGREVLGVEFFNGFRAYYPQFGRSDYFAIIAAGSGSYWAIDHGIKKGGGASYTRF